MECVKNNGQLEKLTLTFHPMDKKPEESKEYLVVWHACDDTYNLTTIWYSTRFGLWGTGDCAKDAYEAIDRSERVFHGGKDCVGWTDADITEVFKKDGEF